MASRSLRSAAQWYLLDFFCDDEQSCALTVFICGTRFHVIADACDFQGSSEIAKTYRSLTNKVAEAIGQEPNLKTNGSGQSNTDSGVDVSGADEERTSDGTKDSSEGADPEAELQQWMLVPLKTTFEGLAASEQASKRQTVQEWYNCTTKYFSLSISKDDEKLQATELDAAADLEDRMQKLKPQLNLPKYITEQLEVSYFRASELEVLAASDQPIGTPYHPCRVRRRGSEKTMFLKVVDNKQPEPTKRELQILNQLKKLGLHQKMKVPIVEGFVTFDGVDQTASGQKRIMGFLQTDIPDPTTLTSLIDESVSQIKRDRWATEVERMKRILHDKGIVWGDAKADNLMVDQEDSLWIIDFGGSYTEGWVDPEIMETKEGDQMGMEKISNALQDPVANTCDLDETGETAQEDARSAASKKRKADDREIDEELPETKRARQSEQTRHDNFQSNSGEGNDEEELYCYCGRPESGKMIACDNTDCRTEWFHFDCVGLNERPLSSEEWFCNDCRSD